MIQFLRDPNYDFMGWGKRLLGMSILFMLAAVVLLGVRGLDYGIEFTGGTELQLKFAETPDVGAIRAALGAAGLAAEVTTIGDPNEREVYIRLATTAGPEQEEDLATRVTEALRVGRAVPNKVDLNLADKGRIAALLHDVPGVGEDESATVAQAITGRRRETAVFRSMDELSSIPGMSATVLDYLRERAFTGPLALRSQSYIGPAIGKELMNKAGLAILGSLVGMLVYIWFRFEFQWGLAAVVALIHDTVITLGLFSLFGKEMTLPVVAAFLTLIGYSVNDTVVIFDRVRENLRKGEGGSLEGLINQSVNQTLSRTIITSGLTFIVIFGLYLFGGPALNAFSFVMTVGVIVGSYSTIYIASPLLVLWKPLFERRRVGTGTRPPVATEPGRRTPAKKVRTTSGRSS